MTEIQLATALTSCLSLAGLWVLLFKLYPDYCVDRFRQDMFDLRADLFDDGQIARGHPAYRLLRQTMNGFIRFGHRVNLLHAMLFFWQTAGVSQSRRRLVPAGHMRWRASKRRTVNTWKRTGNAWTSWWRSI